MMRLTVREFDRAAWTRTVAGYGDLSLPQTWEYAEAKARTGPWRVERALLVEGAATVAACQVLIRPSPAGLPGGLAWINRGPLWRRTEEDGPGPKPEPLLAAVARHYAAQRGFYLRLAPAVPEYSLDEAELERAGLAPAGAAGWASARLDLAADEATLRRGLAQKWRNGLNKAERQGLEVRIGTDAELFAAFLKGHARLAQERGFVGTVTGELLAALQGLLPEGRRLLVLLALAGGRPVGGVLLATYGDVCEYLAGNSDDEGRRLDATRLLLWRAVLAARERGFRRFDLGGMDADLTPPGIYRFKAGLGATPYRLAPEREALGGGLIGRLVRWRVGRARAAG